MDIMVTTPKSMMREAAEEAADCKRAGGGEYFRRFGVKPPVAAGSRVYYVEDGYVRGFAIVDRVVHESRGRQCDTTGIFWPPGWYIFMDARSWKWVRPTPMRGFQGYRLVRYVDPVTGKLIDRAPDRRPVLPEFVAPSDGYFRYEIVGDWLDPKPEAEGD